MLKQVRFDHADIALHNADWQQLAPVVDSQHWPLQLLYRSHATIPRGQDLRFTVFDATREKISIRGEAADYKLTSDFAAKIRRAFPDYEWSLPPGESENKTNRVKFNYEGVLNGGEPES